MKKPLVLLVDDDRAVLEALEALLGPELSEISRLEFFDRPDDVLAAMDGWKQEGRVLALAIVDQKMPAITGVELIRRLREVVKDPFKAIILTGYAGLDSAIEAKNEAGVNRYIEKPWDPSELRGSVAEALAGCLRDSGMSSYLVIKEVRTEAEIESLMRKRYQIYRQSVLREFCPPTPDEINLDGWDLQAHHFGLFLESGGGLELVGNLRVVRDSLVPWHEAIRRIAERHPGFLERLSIPEGACFPLLSYWPDAAAVRERYLEAKQRGESVAEPGRLAVDPVVRRAGVAAFMAEAATGFFFFFFLLDHAILTCKPSHRRLYLPLGFAQLPGTTAHTIPGTGVELLCLWGARTGVPEPAGGRVRALATRAGRAEGMCHCPAYPECVPGPYVTGDFRGVDLFCPLKAGALLRRAETHEG